MVALSGTVRSANCRRRKAIKAFSETYLEGATEVSIDEFIAAKKKQFIAGHKSISNIGFCDSYITKFHTSLNEGMSQKRLLYNLETLMVNWQQIRNEMSKAAGSLRKHSL